MKKLDYDLWASYRRKMLDILQEQYKDLYKGKVLDIGGRNRGKFKKPKQNVDKWIFADVNEEFNPDIVLDVSNMEQIESKSIDVVNAIELFEHVKEIYLGLKECFRVLKNDGVIIISIPFLYPIHADPYDFQRWTNVKWEFELKRIGFRIEKMIIMGNYYTHLAELLKFKLKFSKKFIFPKILLSFLIIPILNYISKLDNKISNKVKTPLSNFHCGYFIIAKKK